MIIDTEKVAAVLSNPYYSGYRLEAETGVTRTIISKFRKGEVKLDNMRLSSIEKIQHWLDQNQIDPYAEQSDEKWVS